MNVCYIVAFFMVNHFIVLEPYIMHLEVLLF